MYIQYRAPFQACISNCVLQARTLDSWVGLSGWRLEEGSQDRSKKSLYQKKISQVNNISLSQTFRLHCKTFFSFNFFQILTINQHIFCNDENRNLFSSRTKPDRLSCHIIYDKSISVFSDYKVFHHSCSSCLNRSEFPNLVGVAGRLK